MKFFVSIFVTLVGVGVTLTAFGDEQGMSQFDNQRLMRRIEDLEFQITNLQSRVRALEQQSEGISSRPFSSSLPSIEPESWICRVRGFSVEYSATGVTKAIADQKASDKCRRHDKDNGFFCKPTFCSQ
jgi:hypothetical protein